MSQDVNDFLDAAGMPGVKFEKVGDQVSGVVVRAAVVQGRDFETGAPMFWDDGSPRMELHVDLDTGIIDRTIEGDDGVRRVYGRGAMIAAIRVAVKKSGAKLLPGGWMRIEHNTVAEPTRKGLNGQKMFIAEYKAPDSVGISADDIA